MVSKKSHVIILKNDAVGDLCQSLNAINNIIINNKDKIVSIYLSERSKKFNFLINGKNLIFKELKYNLSLFEKIKFIYLLFFTKISDIYILTPKNFYYYLPYLFRSIKFHALCINGRKNYKRPNEYLRGFLYKFVINNRAANYKRTHITNLLNQLTTNNNENFKLKILVNGSKFLKFQLPKNYIYFHIKKDIIDKLSWDITKLNLLFNELLNHYDNVIFTKDIEKNKNTDSIYKEFNVVDFQNEKINIKDKSSKITLFDNIEGEDLYYTIQNSSKVLAFHGMMTNLGSLEFNKVLDLWFCDIRNLDDYKNYRNAFYEFKPVYDGYNFRIPSKDISKTIRKIRYSLTK